MTNLVQRLRMQIVTENNHKYEPLLCESLDRIEQLEDEAGQLREQNTYLDGVVAKLEKRLEISPRTKYDGIDCRDETIRQLERENEANERNLCILTDDLAAARRENAELRTDAARYRWIEKEHMRSDPVGHLTWKLNIDRACSELVNTARLGLTPDQIQQWAREAGFRPQSDEWVFNTMLRTFANLLRNATLEEAAVKCEQMDFSYSACEQFRDGEVAVECAKEIRSMK